MKPLICRCYPVFPEYKGNKKTYIIVECPLVKIMSKEDIEKCRKEASKASKKLMEVSLDYSTIPKTEREKVEKRFKRFFKNSGKLR